MDNPIHAFQKAILNPDASVGARDDLLARLVDATSNVTKLDVAVGAGRCCGSRETVPGAHQSGVGWQRTVKSSRRPRLADILPMAVVRMLRGHRGFL